MDTTGLFGLNGNSLLGIGIANTVQGFTGQNFNNGPATNAWQLGDLLRQCHEQLHLRWTT